MPGERKIVVIGAGIAGLCAAVYARKCGYAVELVEQHDRAGGLATSWRRGDYVFETCMHWLVGSRPGGVLHAEWQEVCEIDSLRFVDHDEFLRIEDERGAQLCIYTDVGRLEAELLSVGPEDENEIRHLTKAVRQLVDLPMPPIGESGLARLASMFRMLPDLPLVWRLAHISLGDYGLRFRNPLLRSFFRDGATPNLSALALILSLAWMSGRNAGYAIGGSQALIRSVVDRLQALGGTIRYEIRVERILVENDTACGVVLDSGEIVPADWVISAADGHATLHALLGGRYHDPAFDKAFAHYEAFPSYVQVSLGLARPLSGEPGYLTLRAESPFEVDPLTRLDALAFRIFNYDPTFAPAGKTAVACFLPTRNSAWWAGLRHDDATAYQAAKHRAAEAVIEVLGRRLPGVRDDIEIVDVSTPATVIRFTGNWQGSMEGWLMTPETGFGTLPQTLPHLKRFLMAGHWVQPGGGLPSGLMTARSAVQAICREDHVVFA
ncbi:NAD(P)/FAD-dependent oxidoreductase [Sphingomonas sp. NFR15]|uniref:phytoene desaturase family protein n=1 Tax=Sphingomonas sp. NFR15 TaxID=1566282 RepID=UPI00088AEEE4|nr:NAD(P)/FAD-dependent oxidoreductase [Sphingomonas sp. NFR15]SDA10455.1 Phytoene dehydrogenase-related protein [Sphingomonas sp. NFR15]